MIITASAKDGANASASVSLTVETNLQPGNLLINGLVPVGIGLNVQLTADIDQDVLPENETLIWSSEDPDVAVVNNDGLVTGITEGTAIIKVCPQETGKYCSFAEVEVMDAT